LNISGDGFLDTKTSAMNRHEKFPDPLLRRALKQTEFNMRFTPELAWASFGNAAHQRLTMRLIRSSKINAIGENRANLTTW
jgi:hypothetical protein